MISYSKSLLLIFMMSSLMACHATSSGTLEPSSVKMNETIKPNPTVISAQTPIKHLLKTNSIELDCSQPLIDRTQFDYVNCLYDDTVTWAVKDDKFILVDTQGKPLSTMRFDEVRYFNDGLAVVKIDNKYGYINKNGNIKIALKYDYATTFNKGLATVYIGKQSHIIDTFGSKVD